MIVRRRTWLYRLQGEDTIRSISFALPHTLAQAKQALQRTVGKPPTEVWGRSLDDCYAHSS